MRQAAIFALEKKKINKKTGCTDRACALQLPGNEEAHPRDCQSITRGTVHK